jgi:hypothetical protein
MTVAVLGEARPPAKTQWPLGLEPVIEHVDRSHLVRGGEAGLVVDHGRQVLHLKIVSCGVKIAL